MTDLTRKKSLTAFTTERWLIIEDAICDQLNFSSGTYILQVYCIVKKGWISIVTGFFTPFPVLDPTGQSVHYLTAQTCHLENLAF